jgi:hypothetical protein
MPEELAGKPKHFLSDLKNRGWNIYNAFSGDRRKIWQPYVKQGMT